jgi:transcriptional regulator with XRE-family HTH domain
MEDAGEKLRKVRERLGLTIRHVEEASRRIAAKHKNDEFVVGLSRLSEIENKGTLPSFYRLYSLAVVYRLDILEILEWYGVNVGEMAADAAAIEIARTHPIGFRPGQSGDVLLPLALDPGIDMRKTTFLSRMIQRWGKLPVTLLNGLDLKDHRYAFVGTEDWLMYPLIQPGSLVQIDESRRKIVNTGWTSEFERPIYFVEHRSGFACAWCTLNETQLVLQPHPASMCAAQVFLYPDEVDVLGQVTAVAMRFDSGKRRRGR